MHVDLALLENDELLQRLQLEVLLQPQVAETAHFKVRYWLGRTAADIVLEDFASSVDLKRVALDMPIHESNDWESIDAGRYTVAFWCRLEA